MGHRPGLLWLPGGGGGSSEPTRSDGYNLLTLINHYMDACRRDPADLAARAKSEKYSKILSKAIINPDGENFAQNQYFYDAAEGVLTA